MKYLFFFVLFIITPAMAEFEINDGIRKPQSLVVAGDSVIDDDDTEDEVKIPVEPEFPIGGPSLPDKPIDPFSKAPEVAKPQPIKKTVKKIPTAKIQRSITDDRIDDSYVQDLIKQRFDFSKPIE